MFLNLIPSIKFKHAVSIGLITILNSLHSAIASPIEQPVVTFAVTYCDTAYLIQLFENGKIEYQGSYGVKTLGRHEAQINQQAVNDLLKQFQELGSFKVTDDRLKLPSFSKPGEALYLRQGNKTAFFFNVDDRRFSVNSLFPLLRDKTLLVTNAKQWIDYIELRSCHEHDGSAKCAVKDDKPIKINMLNRI